ncbi:MAG: M14 family zinc carboxypeptidase, partial [Lentisphaeria bacterium]|nr:M14 family zinc carboxypeptidase [Lentisphaeria bacterium]
ERLTQFGAYAQSAVMAGFDYATATTFWRTDSTYQDNTAAYYSEQMHLLGDCSMAARLRPLRELTATAALAENNTRLTITLTWDDNTPAAGATVILTDADGQLQQASITDAAGATTWERHPDCQAVTLKIHDPGAWPYLETIDLGPLLFSSHLGTFFANSYLDLPFLPDDMAPGTLTNMAGLPPGMAIDPDGRLRGTPDTPGAYAISAEAQNNSQIPCLINATLTVITAPDLDRDGAISNQELLASLEECRDFNADDATRNAIIAQWVDSGEPAATRQGGDTAAAEPAGDDNADDDIQPAPAWRVVIQAPDPDTFARLAATGADIVTATETTVTLHGDQDTPERLAAAGFVLINAAPFTPTRASPHPLYPSPEQINDTILDLAREHHGLCRAGYVGASVEQRDILSLRIAAREGGQEPVPKLLVIGAIHGDERPAAVMAIRLAQYLAQTARDAGPAGDRVRDLLAKAEIHILPTVNPDGVAHGTRYNVNGRDLNRDFPDGVLLPELGAFSDPASLRLTGRQPETQALIRWCAAHRFSASLNLHTGALLACYPYGNNAAGSQTYSPTPDDSLMIRLASVYAQANILMRTADWPLNGIINSALWYPVTGEFPDWQYRFLGIHAITVELYRYSDNEGAVNIEGKESTDPEHLDKLWNANRGALLNWLEAASTGVNLAIVDENTGQPVPGAMIRADAGQVMAANRDGLCHRPLTPGTHQLLVSAPGWQPVGPVAVTINDGQAAVVPVALTRTAPVRVSLTPQRHRFLPQHQNRLSWDLTATGTPPAAAILTLTLPVSWPLPALENTSAVAVRRESTHTVALLTLANQQGGLPGRVDLSLPPPPPADLNDHVLETTIIWNGDQQPPRRQHWLTAEPRTTAMNLDNGWNLTGAAIAINQDSPLETDADAWLWDRFAWRHSALADLPPATAAWVYAETPQTIPLQGWMPHEDLPELLPGWNLVFTPWPLTAPEATLFILNQQRTLPRTDMTNDQQPAWLWKK